MSKLQGGKNSRKKITSNTKQCKNWYHSLWLLQKPELTFIQPNMIHISHKRISIRAPAPTNN